MSNNNIDTSVAPNSTVTSILKSFPLPIMKADTGASKKIQNFKIKNISNKLEF